MSVYVVESSGNTDLPYRVYQPVTDMPDLCGSISDGEMLNVSIDAMQGVTPADNCDDGRCLTDTLSPEGRVFLSGNDTVIIPKTLGYGKVYLPRDIPGYMEICNHFYPAAIKFGEKYYAPFLIYDRENPANIRSVLLADYYLPDDAKCLHVQLPRYDDYNIVDLFDNYEDDGKCILVFKTQDANGMNGTLEVTVDIKSLLG